MGFDEAAWVENYVSKGGDRSEGQALAAKMRMARQGEPSSSAPVAPPAAAALATALPSPSHPDPASSSSLFGELPIPPAPPPAAAPLPAGPRPAPVRRGRKPVPITNQPSTQRELDLYQLSMEIEERNAKNTGDRGFLASAMIYASLPHSEVKGGVFKRKNGPTALTILNDPDIGLPFGKMPRIITAFLCTEAKRHHSTRGPLIHLGQSQAEFLQKLGLRSTGGERGDIGRLRDHAKRLFTSTITLTSEKAGFQWDKVNITDSGMLLWNPHDPNAKGPWQSTLVLSQRFFDECVNHSVPISLEVLHSLRSPLAMDIYVWLTYRFNTVAEPTPVTWRQLQWQFGANYPQTAQGERSFRTNFRERLRQVLAVYREAKVDPNRQDCLVLYPSRPHIPA